MNATYPCPHRPFHRSGGTFRRHVNSKPGFLVRGIPCLLLLVGIQAAILQTNGATVFDNLDDPRDEYNSPLGPDRLFAQQFLMDENTAISEVAVELFRLGSVSGSMAFELWTDNGSDDPDAKITGLGTIPDVSVMPTVDTIYSFDALIPGLTPHAKYWVVANHSGLTSPLNGSNTIGWTLSFSDEGAEDLVNAHALRAIDNGVWTEMTDVTPYNVLNHQMRVLSAATKTVVHYDNLDDTGGSLGRALKLWPENPSETPAAQRFVAAADNVTSAALGLARFGSPGGKLIVSIWNVQAATGDPGESLGALGEIEINSLPIIPMNNTAPAFLELVTLQGLVPGLHSGDEYFLVIGHNEEANIDPANTWVFDAVDSPASLDAVALFDGAGNWIRPFPKRVRARIEGTVAVPQLTIQRAVQVSWPESAVTYALESAPTPEGPWQAVTEPVQTVDGENRVNLVTNPGNAYFRLRGE